MINGFFRDLIFISFFFVFFSVLTPMTYAATGVREPVQKTIRARNKLSPIKRKIRAAYKNYQLLGDDIITKDYVDPTGNGIVAPLEATSAVRSTMSLANIALKERQRAKDNSRKKILDDEGLKKKNDLKTLHRNHDDLVIKHDNSIRDLERANEAALVNESKSLKAEENNKPERAKALASGAKSKRELANYNYMRANRHAADIISLRPKLVSKTEEFQKHLQGKMDGLAGADTSLLDSEPNSQNKVVESTSGSKVGSRVYAKLQELHKKASDKLATHSQEAYRVSDLVANRTPPYPDDKIFVPSYTDKKNQLLAKKVAPKVLSAFDNAYNGGGKIAATVMLHGVPAPFLVPAAAQDFSDAAKDVHAVVQDVKQANRGFNKFTKAGVGLSGAGDAKLIEEAHARDLVQNPDLYNDQRDSKTKAKDFGNKIVDGAKVALDHPVSRVAVSGARLYSSAATAAVGGLNAMNVPSMINRGYYVYTNLRTSKDQAVSAIQTKVNVLRSAEMESPTSRPSPLPKIYLLNSDPQLQPASLPVKPIESTKPLELTKPVEPTKLTELTGDAIQVTVPATKPKN